MNAMKFYGTNEASNYSNDEIYLFSSSFFMKKIRFHPNFFEKYFWKIYLAFLKNFYS